MQLLAHRALKDSPHCLDWRDDAKNTPFHIAALKGCVHVARLLIEAGCNVNCTNLNWQTPLHLAAIDNDIKIARLLLETGCNVNCKDINGITPLHFAVAKRHVDVVRLLLEARCNGKVEDMFSLTPLLRAVSSDDSSILQLLLQHGADPNQTHVSNLQRLGLLAHTVDQYHPVETVSKDTTKSGDDGNFHEEYGHPDEGSEHRAAKTRCPSRSSSNPSSDHICGSEGSSTSDCNALQSLRSSSFSSDSVFDSADALLEAP